jgi:hypothetical protein
MIIKSRVPGETYEEFNNRPGHDPQHLNKKDFENNKEYCIPLCKDYGYNREKSMAGLEMKIEVDTTELDRLAIGGRLYDALKWKNNGIGKINIFSILQHDRETKEILIKESDLMKMIQLVNQGQPDRSIRIVK